jgi:hypothetical protein
MMDSHPRTPNGPRCTAGADAVSTSSNLDLTASGKDREESGTGERWLGGASDDIGHDNQAAKGVTFEATEILGSKILRSREASLILSHCCRELARKIMRGHAIQPTTSSLIPAPPDSACRIPGLLPRRSPQGDELCGKKHHAIVRWEALMSSDISG